MPLKSAEPERFKANKTAGEPGGRSGVRGLDEFNRYIEKSEARQRAGDAPVPPEPPTVKPSRDPRDNSVNVRYVLRGGMTIAIPVTETQPAGKTVYREPLASPDATMWQRLPRHIQLLIRLADSQEEEAAQKYYSREFKESRRQLIERLLDPTLTLEDTARVLGVVPATVRRYTNRGVLPHHRTVGQQRRFKLSDVLSFLEAQQAGKIGDVDEDSGDDSDED